MKIKLYTLMLLLLLPLGVSAKLDEPTKARLMNEANSLFNLGEYEKARETYKQVYIEDGDAVSDAQIEKCDQCMDLIKTAMTDVIKGDYEAAVNSYQEVMKINPADMKVQQQIIDCRKRQYEPKLKLAQQLYREGKYEQAMIELNEYTAQTGLTDTALLTKIINCSNWETDANKAIKQSNFDVAIEKYKSILTLNPSDFDTQKKIYELEAKLASSQNPYPNKNRANVQATALSLIPGLGLIQKGRKGEGAAYLLGDLALVGGGVGMLSYANKQQNIMNDRNTSFDQYNKAKSNYNMAKTVSYCCFGAGAALYIVNLVRSFVATPKPGARIQWAFAPILDSTSPLGQNLSVNFAFVYNF